MELEMITKIGIFITSMNLISMAIYLILAGKSMQSSHKSMVTLLNNIIELSFLSIIISVILTVKIILVNYGNNIAMEAKAFVSVVAISAIISLVVILIVPKYKMKYKVKSCHYYLGFSLLYGLIFAFFPIDIRVMAYSSLFIYSCAMILLYSKIKRVRIKYSCLSFQYMIGGVLGLLFLQIIQKQLHPSFFIVLYLSMTILVQISYFLFYMSIYSAFINKGIKEVENSNKKIIACSKKIKELAYYDSLTGLWNNNKLIMDMEKNSSIKTMGLINIKNFMNYNNLVGYKKGNEALKYIGELILENLDKGEFVYRYYSDKFVIISKKNIDDFCNRTSKCIKKFSSTPYSKLSVSVYMGAIEYEANISFEEAIKQLEIASTHAKKNNQLLCRYDDLNLEIIQQKIALEFEVKEAVKSLPFELYYQPKISISTNKIYGFEALIRWKHNEKWIPPNIFIPLAEEMGVINIIGNFVIDKAFGFVEQVSQYGDGQSVSINLSPYQLKDKRIVDYIQQMQKYHQIDPSQVIFEITETAIINNVAEAVHTIRELRQLGYRFSIDDFGIGYSCLNYFAEFDLDEVKFDKKFADQLLDKEKRTEFFEGAIKLFKSLNLFVVAEGIETEEQKVLIEKFGCDCYQGYLYSPAVSMVEAVGLLEKEKK